jgi:hypothetical protein
MRPFVIIESPFRGDTPEAEAANVAYARAALADSIRRGECPFASHLLYTQALNDTLPHERALGIALGLRVSAFADFVAVYSDRGTSDGMARAIEKHLVEGRRIEYRSLKPAATIREGYGERKIDVESNP